MRSLQRLLFLLVEALTIVAESIATESPSTLSPSARACTNGYVVWDGGRTYLSNVGGSYKPNLHCRFTVEASNVNFTSFDVEDRYDRLYYFEGDNTDFDEDDASGELTGSRAPFTISSSNGHISFLWKTDSSIQREGWRFQIVGILTKMPTATAEPTLTPTTLSPTLMPTTSSPMTQAPSMRAKILPGNTRYQLGGPADYNATILGTDDNVPLLDQQHMVIQGIGNDENTRPTLSCFYDLGALNPGDVTPWLSSQSPFNGTHPHVGSLAFKLTITNANLDFARNSCGAFRVRNLVLRNSRVTGIHAGFLLDRDRVSVVLDNVEIVDPRPDPAEYVVYAVGQHVAVEVVNSRVESYKFQQSALGFQANDVRLTFSNNLIQRVEGSPSNAAAFIHAKIGSRKTNASIFDGGSIHISSNIFADVFGFQTLAADVEAPPICIGRSCTMDVSVAATRLLRCGLGRRSRTSDAPNGTVNDDLLPSVFNFRGRFRKLDVEDLVYVDGQKNAQTRGCLLQHNTTRTPITMRDVVVGNSDLSAVIYDLSSTGSGGSHPTNRMTITNLSVSCSSEAPMNETDSIVRSKYLPPSWVSLSDIEMSLCNHALVYSDTLQALGNLSSYIRVSQAKLETPSKNRPFSQGLIIVRPYSEDITPAVDSEITVRIEATNISDRVIREPMIQTSGFSKRECILDDVTIRNITNTQGQPFVDLSPHGRHPHGRVTLILDRVTAVDVQPQLSAIKALETIITIRNSIVRNSCRETDACLFIESDPERQNSGVGRSTNVLMRDSAFIDTGTVFWDKAGLEFHLERSRFIRNQQVLNLDSTSSRLTMLGCTLEGWPAEMMQSQYRGGAIFSKGDRIIVIDSHFSGYTARDSGGAIFIDKNERRSEYRFTSSIFTGNNARNGGAIYAVFESSRKLELRGCSFRGNRASKSGGAVASGRLDDDGSTYNSNFAGESGGDIAAFDAKLTNVVFLNSSAEERGGSMYISLRLFDIPCREKSMLVLNTALVNGTKASLGSVLYCEIDGTAEISRLTVERASARDGTIYLAEKAKLTMTNSMLNSIESVDGGLLHQAIYSSAILTDITCTNFEIAGLGGIVLLDAGSTTSIVDSLFRNVKVGANGGVLHLANQATVSVRGSTFEQISALSGGLVWMLGGSLNVTSSVIDRVTASLNGGSGGVIQALGTAIVHVNDSLLRYCAAYVGGLVRLSNTARMTLSSSRMFRPSAGVASLAQLEDFASIKIFNSTVEGGHATSHRAALIELLDDSMVTLTSVQSSYSSGSAGIAMSGSSKLVVKQCAFLRHSIDFHHSSSTPIVSTGYLRAIDSSSVSVTASEFTGNNATAVVLGGRASLDTSWTTFDRNRALPGDSGGALSINTNGSVRIANCTFTRNSAPSATGGAIHVRDTVASVSSSYFEANTALMGGAVRVEDKSNVVLVNSSFCSNHGTYKGGAISLKNGSLTISKVTLRNNSAREGGAVSASTYKLLHITHSLFESNAAHHHNQSSISSSSTSSSSSGGGNAGDYPTSSYATDPTLGVMATLPPGEDNPNLYPVYPKGGALYMMYENTSRHFISETRFAQNRAEQGAGGAIYLDKKRDNSLMQPFLADKEQQEGCKNLLTLAYEGNVAEQGDNLASSPQYLLWTGKATRTFSGMRFNTSIHVNVTDCYNQLVRENITLSITANSYDGMEMDVASYFTNGTLTTRTGHGCFGIQCPNPMHTVFTASPGKKFTFHARASWARLLDSGSYETQQLVTKDTPLTINGCVGGSIPVDGSCQSCPAGTYQDGNACLDCPAGKFSSEAATECTSCAASPHGGYAPQKGSVSCIQCSAEDNLVASQNSTSCVPCAENSERSGNISKSWQCICKQGFFTYEDSFFEANLGFDDRLNPESCDSCPAGGNCQVTPVTDVNMQPLEDYWHNKWEKDTLSFLECRNDACIGERDQCAKGYYGVLCTECENGYGRVREYECVQCSSPKLAILAILGAWTLASGIGICLAYINVKEAEAAMDGQGDNDTSSVLIKILLSALQFNSIAVTFDYEWPSFLSDFLSAEGAIGVSLGSLLSIDCVQPADSHMRPFYANTIIMACIPLAVPFLALATVGILATKWLEPKEKKAKDPTADQGNKDEVPSIQYLSSLPAMPSIQDQVQIHVVEEEKEDVAEVRRRENDLSNTKLETVCNQQPEKAGRGARQDLLDQPSEEDAQVMRELQKVSAELMRKQKWAQFYSGVMSLFFMLYPSLILWTFRLFNCEQLGSTEESIILVSDMSQQCWVGTHLIYIVCLGIPMMVVYVIGFPTYCLIMLFRHRRDIFFSNTHNDDYLHFEELFRRQRDSMGLYLLYHGFKPNFYCFEVVVMVRKVFIVMIAVFVINGITQALLANILVVVALVLHLMMEPYVNRTLNVVELCALLMSFVTYTFGAMLNNSPTSWRVVFSVLILGVNVLFFGITGLLICREVYRGYKMRSTSTKHQGKRVVHTLALQAKMRQNGFVPTEALKRQMLRRYDLGSRIDVIHESFLRREDTKTTDASYSERIGAAHRRIFSGAKLASRRSLTPLSARVVTPLSDRIQSTPSTRQSRHTPSTRDSKQNYRRSQDLRSTMPGDTVGALHGNPAADESANRDTPSNSQPSSLKLKRKCMTFDDDTYTVPKVEAMPSLDISVHALDAREVGNDRDMPPILRRISDTDSEYNSRSSSLRWISIQKLLTMSDAPQTLPENRRLLCEEVFKVGNEPGDNPEDSTKYKPDMSDANDKADTKCNGQLKLTLSVTEERDDEAKNHRGDDNVGHNDHSEKSEN